MDAVLKIFEQYPILLYGLFLLSIFFFTGTFFSNVFDVKKEKAKNTRLKQLNKVKDAKRETDSTRRLIQNLSKPAYDNYVKKQDYDTYKLKALNKKLRIAGWDKNMNAIEYIAFDLTMKSIGAFLAIFFMLLDALPLSILMVGVFAFMPTKLLNNSVSTRMDKLASDFPDFISILGGYLEGGLDIIPSAEKTKKYLNKEWCEVIDKFVSIGHTQSKIEALNYLRDEVDIFAIQEIVSLLRLSTEQGINPSEGIKQQYDTIQEMHKDSMLKKISNRKVYAYCVQGPVLLMSLVTFGLPTFYQMFTFGSLQG